MKRHRSKGPTQLVDADTRASNQDKVLRLVLGASISALRDEYGRVSGLTFNKLVMDLYWKLSEAENKAFHFVVPHRWYLYGAVVDDYSLRHLIKLDHPENEFETSVEPVSDTILNVRDPPAGLREEVEPFCREFALKYGRKEDISAMLQNHYRKAPFQFQKAYLNWSQLTRDILWGYKPDSSNLVGTHFEKLIKSYETRLEPRLTSAFGRLALYLDPIINERITGDLKTLKTSVYAMTDFWATFCFFLSLRCNVGIPDDRLSAYQKHAETELRAYKRRLSAFLEEGYLQERLIATRLGQEITPLSRFIADQTIEVFEGGEKTFGSQ